jgi:hypothetical protein
MFFILLCLFPDTAESSPPKGLVLTSSSPYLVDGFN